MFLEGWLSLSGEATGLLAELVTPAAIAAAAAVMELGLSFEATAGALQGASGSLLVLTTLVDEGSIVALLEVCTWADLLRETPLLNLAPLTPPPTGD